MTRLAPSPLRPSNSPIALIRPHRDHTAYLGAFIAAAGFPVLDINTWRQIDYGAVLDDGSTECTLAGLPLSACGAIVFYGVPQSSPGDLQAQPMDRTFIDQERNQALLAAFASSKVRLLNSGVWIDFHRILSRPEAQLRMLSTIGWKTPAVSWQYDFAAQIEEKSRIPEPDQRVFLILTRHRHVLIPAAPLPECDSLMARTRDYMTDIGLDWCTLTLGVVGKEVVAYGLTPELPEILPPSTAGDLIRRAIRIRSR